MVCAHPKRGWWSKNRHPSTGNPYVVFSRSEADTSRPIDLPCGKCINCKLSRSFEWSVRCTCESFYHSENYFLTLTYDKEHLPPGRLLRRLDVQLFLKRLRSHLSRIDKKYKIKVFYCGEYGERRRRPHYHMIVFGLPLKELNYVLFPTYQSKRGHVQYCNPKIDELWQNGFVTISDFTPATASYVAQYTFKKQKSNSLCEKIVKPFIGMSLRTPIGFDFFLDNWKSVFSPRGFHLPLGKSGEQVTVRPFRFFKRSLEKILPSVHHVKCTIPSRMNAAFARFCDEAAISPLYIAYKETVDVFGANFNTPYFRYFERVRKYLDNQIKIADNALKREARLLRCQEYRLGF